MCLLLTRLNLRNRKGIRNFISTAAILVIKLARGEAVLLLLLVTAYNLATNFGHNRESGFSCQIVLDY
jgi:hypothetical protein